MNLLVRPTPEDAEAQAAAVASRPLRVALVSGSYNYIKDGIALTLNRLVAFLLRNGVEVLVFAPVSSTPAFEPAGTIVPIASIPLPLRAEYRVALGFPEAARQRMKAFAPDLIHIAVPDLLGYGALRTARAWNIPVVASYHTRYETYLRHYGLTVARPLIENYLRNFYGSTRELYVPSQSMAERLKADGVDVPMHLWSRGVDSERFHPAKRSAAWRAKQGIGQDEFVVLFVSRLVREKQLSTLADVLLTLKKQGVTHRSIIVGDGPERPALQKQLPDTIFTGFQDGDDLATAYASSDLFLFPSDTELFGNVTLEAMASGLPTICADATGSRSLVVPGTTGELIAPGDVEGFASEIEALATDRAKVARMGAAARIRALEFGWDEPMHKLLARYRSIAS